MFQSFPGSSHEVSSILNEIEEHVGPRSLVIVAVVSPGKHAELNAECSDFKKRTVFVETEYQLPTRISKLATNTKIKYHLMLVVSPTIRRLEIHVPQAFRHLEVVACVRTASLRSSKELTLANSTYCDIDLSKWNGRRTFSTHELTPRDGVAIELPDDDGLGCKRTPAAYALNGKNNVQTVARRITNLMDKRYQAAPAADSALHWITGLSGRLVGLGTIAVLVTNVRIGRGGLDVFTAPFKASYANSTVLGCGRGGLAACGTRLAAGVCVAAAVYHIPWKRLARWLTEQWPRFLALLESIWPIIEDAMAFLERVLPMIIRVKEVFGMWERILV